MKRLALIFLFYLYGFSLFAQYSIEGIIKDDMDIPMELANVLLFAKSDSTFIKGSVSKEEGEFMFEQVTRGSYYLLVSALGYANYYSPSFEVERRLVLPFDVNLSVDAQLLKEVAVVAQKPLFVQEIDRTVVNVQNSITAAGANVLEVLERSPGIDVDRMNNAIAMQGRQGVIVMLNGKALRIDGEALLQLLQSMPANNVVQIDLITTPPASYDAQGNAGIIDIITIKKENEGFNGGITSNIAYGLRPKYGSSFNFNLRKQQFNLFTDFSANYTKAQEDANIQRRSTFGEQIIFSDIRSRRPATTGLYNGRIGIDFDLSENTVVGVLFSGYLRHWRLDAQTTTTINDNLSENTVSIFDANEINNWSHWLGNVNFRHTFKGKSSLSFDFDYLEYYDTNPVQYEGRTFGNEGILQEEEAFDSNKETPIDFKVVKVDYTKPFSEALSVQAGIKGTVSSFTNNLSVTRFENGQAILDPRFTDLFYMDEEIGAAYLSADYQFSDQLSTKAGLRYEYYFSELGSQSEGQLLMQDFGRFFPSLFLSYQMNDHQSLQLSYNERITRPAFNNLAPAFFFWNNNTILGGNPQVKPTISQSIGLNLRHKQVLFSLQFTDMDNPITLVLDQEQEDNFTITRATNMADSKLAMASVNLPLQITDWWESRYNIAAYWQQLKPIFETTIITRKGVYMTANTTQQFKLPRGFELELTANLRSPFTVGFGKIPFRGTANLGIQKTIGKHSKLNLSWNDLFDLGSFFRIELDQPEFDLYYNWHYEVEGNVIRLSYSWQFGNSSLKESPNRKTGSETERQRMN